MSSAAFQPPDPQIQGDGKRLVIPVPWRQAEGVRNQLSRRGIGSTLCLIPYSEQAFLEVWPGIDAVSVWEALALSDN
jgi:hypothetical protein